MWPRLGLLSTCIVGPYGLVAADRCRADSSSWRPQPLPTQRQTPAASALHQSASDVRSFSLVSTVSASYWTPTTFRSSIALARASPGLLSRSGFKRNWNDAVATTTRSVMKRHFLSGTAFLRRAWHGLRYPKARMSALPISRGLAPSLAHVDDNFEILLRRQGWHLIRAHETGTDPQVIQWNNPFTRSSTSDAYSAFYSALNDGSDVQ